MTSDVAVVTVVHGRHQHLTRQQRSLSTGDLVPDHWVVVAMDDEALTYWRTVTGVQPTVVAMASLPQELPLAAARNRGAHRALDLGAEVLVFLDVDCIAGPALVSAYTDIACAKPRTVWSGPVTYLPAGLGEHDLLRPWEHLDAPHPSRPAPAPGDVVEDGSPDHFWGLSFALSAQAWTAGGGFREECVGYGGEDTDFALQVLSRGLELGWLGAARAHHQHHPVNAPPVDHVDDILRNAALFRRRWGHWPMQGWLGQFADLGLIELTASGWVRTPGTAAATRTARRSAAWFGDSADR